MSDEIGVRELSRRAGLDSAGADVSRIENAKQGTPSYDKIRALAAVLGVRSEWLWSGEGERDAGPSVRDDDPIPERADAIRRMRGAVCEDAILAVRGADLGRLSLIEWVEELVRADRLARRRRAG